MEPEGSLPHSHPHSLFGAIVIQVTPPQSHFLKIHFNIILQPTLRSSKLSLPLGFPHQNRVYIFPLPHAYYRFILPDFYHPNNIGWAVQIIKLLIM